MQAICFWWPPEVQAEDVGLVGYIPEVQNTSQAGPCAPSPEREGVGLSMRGEEEEGEGVSSAEGHCISSDDEVSSDMQGQPVIFSKLL